jgi:hypothetical protein
MVIYFQVTMNCMVFPIYDCNKVCYQRLRVVWFTLLVRGDDSRGESAAPHNGGRNRRLRVNSLSQCHVGRSRHRRHRNAIAPPLAGRSRSQADITITKASPIRISCPDVRTPEMDAVERHVWHRPALDAGGIQACKCSRLNVPVTRPNFIILCCYLQTAICWKLVFYNGTNDALLRSSLLLFINSYSQSTNR